MKMIHSRKVILILAALFLFVATGSCLAGDEILAVQQELTTRGFDPGPVDGILGPKTRAAIRDFQRASKLTVTGRLDNETLDALGLSFRSALIPSHTNIHVHLNDYLDSGETPEGTRFSMTVSRPVSLGEEVAIPVGTRISGTVAEVESARRPQKPGRMVLRPDSLRVRDEVILLPATITAEGSEIKGQGSIQEDLKKIGIAAGVGAVIGGILKGGEGALAGLLIGGGGTFLGTKGEQVELEPETPLIVELQESISVPMS